MRRGSFSGTHFFPRKKKVSLLPNEQSPIKILKIKNVGNVRFPFLIAPHYQFVNVVIGFGRGPQILKFVFGFLLGNWLKLNLVFPAATGRILIESPGCNESFDVSDWPILIFLKFNIPGFKNWAILYSNLSSFSSNTFFLWKTQQLVGCFLYI